MLLAVSAFAVQLLALVLSRLRAAGWARRLYGVPMGFQTAVEAALGARLRRELLGLDAPRGSPLDATVDALIARYAETRRAAADVTAALIVGLIGWVAFDRFTPGAVSAGQELAVHASQYVAVHDFFLGATIGGWYYRLFPPETPLWTMALAVVTVTLTMSLATAFAGLVADPVQARLGVHRRRLRRWLETLERLSGPIDGKPYKEPK